MIPYEAILYHTGDKQVKVNGYTFELDDDLWSKLDNFDITLEDNEVTAIVGAMSPEQYQKLLYSEDETI